MQIAYMSPTAGLGMRGVPVNLVERTSLVCGPGASANGRLVNLHDNKDLNLDTAFFMGDTICGRPHSTYG